MMRTLIITILGTLTSLSQDMHRQAVPAQALLSAKAAVEHLGQEIRKGNLLYSLDKMYPRWKVSAAKQVGGEQALRKRLESVPQEMQKQGISIIDLKVGDPTTAFEVKGEHFTDSNKAPIFSEYLVLVPTTTLYRIIGEAGVIKRIESKGYQAAIATKSNPTQWTYIDGANLSINELRSLFPLLPKDEKMLKLPLREVREIELSN